MIVHHPSRDVLLSYATGGVPESISLIIATHLAFCPECRAVVRFGESIGGAILESLPPEPVPGAVFEKIDRRLKDCKSAAPADEPLPSVPGNAPEPLHSYLGKNLDQVRWIPITSGLAYWPLIGGACSAKLLRSKPGYGIGMHTHKGNEFSLVLAGGYTDSSGKFGRGDFQSANVGVLHRPVADEGADCIVLAVTDAPLTFSNPIIGFIAKAMGY